MPRSTFLLRKKLFHNLWKVQTNTIKKSENTMRFSKRNNETIENSKNNLKFNGSKE
jgi:hypothetical protein